MAPVALSLLLLPVLMVYADTTVQLWADTLPPVTEGMARRLTHVGRSNWMLFLTAGCAGLLWLQARRAEPGARGHLVAGARAALAGFAAVAVTGLIAALLKQVLGRARAKLFDVEGPFSWHPFAFDHDFASFPSGHATSLFAMAVFLGYLAPRLRPLFTGLAAALAFTRVVVDAHYLSDIAAGALLGHVGAVLLLARAVDAGWIPPARSGAHAAMLAACARAAQRMLRRAHLLVGPDAAAPSLRTTGAMSAAWLAMFVCVLLFINMPWIDIAVSQWFFDPATGFAHAPLTRMLRQLVKLAIIAPLVLVLVLYVTGLIRPRRMCVSTRLWAFVLVAYALGPGLVVNVILKDHWGRARPAQIEAFGGEASFTGPFVLSDQCWRNCSFVSGEGSAIFTTALIAGLLLWPHVRRRPWMQGALLAIPAVGMALRVITGRHFLSDTLFGALICLLIVLALYDHYGVRRRLPTLTARAVAQDLRTAWRTARLMRRLKLRAGLRAAGAALATPVLAPRARAERA